MSQARGAVRRGIVLAVVCPPPDPGCTYSYQDDEYCYYNCGTYGYPW